MLRCVRPSYCFEIFVFCFDLTYSGTHATLCCVMLTYCFHAVMSPHIQHHTHFTPIILTLHNLPKVTIHPRICIHTHHRDHNPTTPREIDRVRRAGGSVYNGRYATCCLCSVLDAL
jgi:hypothetical protein